LWSPVPVIGLRAAALGLVVLVSACGGPTARDEPAPPTVQRTAQPTLAPATAVTETAPLAGGEEGESAMALVLTSSAFAAGEPIPAKFSCDGEDVSPALAWGEPPAGTESFALIMDDPDAPAGTWVHWVLFNIPPEARSLPEAIGPDPTRADGSRHGTSSFRSLGYGGPCPPGGTHRYFFKLYALDVLLDLRPGATVAELEAAMQGHVLAAAELMGTYSR
jgi:Raf kinase inhibitor-like YbhB/YbcL family protein